MADQDATKLHEFIAGRIQRDLTKTRTGQKWWSLANHGSTVLVVVFSALAAVSAQLPDDHPGLPVKHIATIFSLLVTIVSAVQSKLGFERKWIANRMTQSALRQLEIDDRMGQPPETLATAYKAIIARHDQIITEVSSSGKAA